MGENEHSQQPAPEKPASAGDEHRIAVIDAAKFDAARHDPAVKAFLEQALAQEDRLERDGLIHP